MSFLDVQCSQRQTDEVLPISDKLRTQISSALEGFQRVPPERWLRECIICLLTPQSSPLRAEAAVTMLEGAGVHEGRVTVPEIAEILRTKESYVRFHNVKAVRVKRLVDDWSEIFGFLSSGHSPTIEREFLVKRVNGFGLKESSHALRNIGRRNLAILDRHILRKLLEYEVIDNIPSTLSNRKYLEIEDDFRRFAVAQGEELDVIDLFFWSQGTGFVFK